MELDLNDVKTFVAIAQAGTLSAAAKELGVPTSTVSRALTRLEESTGTMLCKRSHKGLILTDPGNEYLATCKRALRSLRDGYDLLAHHRDTLGGLIRIACPVAFARDVLAPALIHFIEAYPRLRVEIDPYASGSDYEPRDDVDVFFKMKAGRGNRKMQCFPGTTRALFAAATYLETHGTPTNPAELEKHRCVGFGTWKLTRNQQVVTPDITLHVIASDPGIQLQLACKAVGIAVLPLWMARIGEAERVLIPVLPGWTPEPTTECALYSGTTKVVPKVRAFLDFITQYFGTDLDPRVTGNNARDLFTGAVNTSGTR